MRRCFRIPPLMAALSPSPTLLRWHFNNRRKRRPVIPSPDHTSDQHDRERPANPFGDADEHPDEVISVEQRPAAPRPQPNSARGFVSLAPELDALKLQFIRRDRNPDVILDEFESLLMSSLETVTHATKAVLAGAHPSDPAPRARSTTIAAASDAEEEFLSVIKGADSVGEASSSAPSVESLSQAQKHLELFSDFCKALAVLVPALAKHKARCSQKLSPQCPRVAAAILNLVRAHTMRTLPLSSLSVVVVRSNQDAFQLISGALLAVTAVARHLIIDKAVFQSLAAPIAATLQEALNTRWQIIEADIRRNTLIRKEAEGHTELTQQQIASFGLCTIASLRGLQAACEYRSVFVGGPTLSEERPSDGCIVSERSLLPRYPPTPILERQAAAAVPAGGILQHLHALASGPDPSFFSLIDGAMLLRVMAENGVYSSEPVNDVLRNLGRAVAARPVSSPPISVNQISEIVFHLGVLGHVISNGMSTALGTIVCRVFAAESGARTRRRYPLRTTQQLSVGLALLNLQPFPSATHNPLVDIVLRQSLLTSPSAPLSWFVDVAYAWALLGMGTPKLAIILTRRYERIVLSSAKSQTPPTASSFAKLLYITSSSAGDWDSDLRDSWQRLVVPFQCRLAAVLKRCCGDSASASASASESEALTLLSSAPSETLHGRIASELLQDMRLLAQVAHALQSAGFHQHPLVELHMTGAAAQWIFRRKRQQQEYQLKIQRAEEEQQQQQQLQQAAAHNAPALPLAALPPPPPPPPPPLKRVPHSAPVPPEVAAIATAAQAAAFRRLFGETCPQDASWHTLRWDDIVSNIRALCCDSVSQFEAGCAPHSADFVLALLLEKLAEHAEHDDDFEKEDHRRHHQSGINAALAPSLGFILKERMLQVSLQHPLPPSVLVGILSSMQIMAIPQQLANNAMPEFRDGAAACLTALVAHPTVSRTVAEDLAVTAQEWRLALPKGSDDELENLLSRAIEKSEI